MVSLLSDFFVAPSGRSVLRGRGRFGPPDLHALFSVLRGAKRPSPAGAWGSAPHPPINQSAKSFVSLAVEGLALWACTVSFVISNYSGSPACGSTPLICNKSVQSAVPHSGSLCAHSGVLDAAVGHIGPIGRLGWRLSPLCTTASPSPRRGVPFSVLRSPGRRKPPLVLCGSRVASGFIAAKGGGSGFNLRGSSKLPSLQASKPPSHLCDSLCLQNFPGDS